MVCLCRMLQDFGSKSQHECKQYRPKSDCFAALYVQSDPDSKNAIAGDDPVNVLTIYI